MAVQTHKAGHQLVELWSIAHIYCPEIPCFVNTSPILENWFDCKRKIFSNNFIKKKFQTSKLSCINESFKWWAH